MGFLINLPIISYYGVGTILTPAQLTSQSAHPPDKTCQMGFLINLPIISYDEVGTILTPAQLTSQAAHPPDKTCQMEFLINLPIISYDEVGTILTPAHSHSALMGVFGMLAIAPMVFVLRETSDDPHWAGIEKYVKVAFWGTNAGLAMMVTMNLFL